MRKFLFALLMLGSLFAVRFGHSQLSLCAEGEYFSDYTNKCEKSRLLVGFGDKVFPADLSAFKTSELTIDKNPAYEKNGTVEKARRYRGVRLRDILAGLLPTGESLDNYVLAVTCLDGFDPVMDHKILSRLNSADALIATEQLDIQDARSGISKDGKWELVPAGWGIVSPGPFYMVWSESEGTYWQGWPLQIKSMRLIRASEYQNALTKLQPAKEFLGQKPKTKIEEGYDQFRGKCLTCHQLNGIGGKKAEVDLLSVISTFASDKESLELLKAVVQNPPPAMSDIKDIKISADDLERINLYLRQAVRK